MQSISTPDFGGASAQLLRSLRGLGIDPGIVSPDQISDLLRAASNTIDGLARQSRNAQTQRDILALSSSSWFWFWDIARAKVRIESPHLIRGSRQAIEASSWKQLLHSEGSPSIESIEAWPTSASPTLVAPVQFLTGDDVWHQFTFHGQIMLRSEFGESLYAAGVLYPINAASDGAVGEEPSISNTSVIDFLANISHEIRTPMSAILGAACVAVESNDPAERDSLISTIKNSAESLIFILSDALDLASLQNGQIAISRKAFNPVRVITDVCRMFHVEAKTKRLLMIIRCGLGVSRNVISDPSRFRQIMVNLISNAVKFTPHGEIEVTVFTRSHERSENKMRLDVSVKDTGIGIPIEKHGKIFEMFHQADTSVKRKYGGTGIGLTVSRKIARLLGGDLCVESDVGAGSVFKLSIELGNTENAADVNFGLLKGRAVVTVIANRSLEIAVSDMISALGGAAVAIRGEESLDQFFSQLTRTSGEGISAAIFDIDAFNPTSNEFASKVAHSIDTLRIPPNHLVFLAQRASPPKQALNALSLLGVTVIDSPFSCDDLAAIFQSNATDVNADLMPLSCEGPYTPTTYRILLVEDNSANRMIIEKVLLRAGHYVIAVENGEQAVNAFQNYSGVFDAIIMDVQMPVMDGLEAAQAIRACEERRSWVNESGWRITPILGLTADAVEGVQQRCIDAGMNSILLKPVLPVTILSAIQALCGSNQHVCEATPEAFAPTSVQPLLRKLIRLSADHRTKTGDSLIDAAIIGSWVGDDMELLARLIRNSASELPVFVASVDEMLSKSMLSNVSRHAHKIKSTLDILGAKSLCSSMATLQRATADSELDTSTTIWRELKPQLEALCRIMNAAEDLDV